MTAEELVIRNEAFQKMEAARKDYEAATEECSFAAAIFLDEGMTDSELAFLREKVARYNAVRTEYLAACRLFGATYSTSQLQFAGAA